MLQHDKNIEEYCRAHSSPLSDILYDLERETHLKTTLPRMLSGDLQGQFLKLITATISAKYVVEVGTFTGYSAICMASAMSEGSRLITFEVNDEMQPFYDKYFPQAGVENIIEVRFGDAARRLEELEEGIDLVFIDADKKSYPLYYDILLPKVRPNGLILIDNVLWSGKVLDKDKDKNTEIIDALNKRLTNDDRIENFLSYIRDGLMICRKL